MRCAHFFVKKCLFYEDFLTLAIASADDHATLQAVDALTTQIVEAGVFNGWLLG